MKADVETLQKVSGNNLDNSLNPVVLTEKLSCVRYTEEKKGGTCRLEASDVN